MDRWDELARRQDGLVARRQLLALGVDADRVRNHVRAQRWVARSSTVISTFTGELTWAQRAWLGVLHAGGTALVGGLSALELQGLKNWHRDEITVLVDDQRVIDPIPDIDFVRTRRPLPSFATSSALPLCRVEPAALLFAGYDRSPRTAQGLLAAVIQQRLSSVAALRTELHALKPLRRAPLFRQTLSDIAGGAHSLAEIDLGRICGRAGLPRPRRQVKRRDAQGRARFIDCEWNLADGRTLILEIDGAFHMDVVHWEADLARQRALSAQGRTIIRCTARELREDPASVVSALRSHGLCG